MTLREPWNNLSLRTKTLVLVALPALPVVVIWGLVGIQLASQVGTNPTPPGRRMDATARFARLEAAMAVAESAARTTMAGDGGSVVIERFNAAESEARTHLDRFDAASTDPQFQADLKEIASLARAHFDRLAPIVREGRSNPRALAEATNAVANVHARIEGLLDRAAVAATETQRRSRRAQWIVLILLFAASAVAVGAGLAGAGVLARSLGRRASQIAGMADALVRGEPLDEPPPGNDEIAVLGRQLHQAAVRLRQQQHALEASNRELEAFSYSVSHDLRAPLRAIDGFSQVIQEEAADRLDDEGRDALRRVRAAATRMGLLIDELLNLSRISRQDLKREQVDLSSMAASVAAELRRRDPSRRAEFSIAPDLYVQADARMLRIALGNLFDNAWKYTSRTPETRIEFLERRENGERIFEIRDNGAGFDMTYAGKLFTAFQRLHSDREFDGTGIGLAIVQRIIHRHGGRIWADGAVGRGATFHFTIDPHPTAEATR